MRRAFDRAALRLRTALYAVVMMLLCGCAHAGAPVDIEMPPLPELVLSCKAGKLAVELADAAGLQNVFKLTYGEMTDLYELVIDPFHELIVYIPGAGGDDALFLGVLNSREELSAAQAELDFLIEQLRATNPALPDPQTLARGRYILYVCAETPGPALTMFEHALVWRA